MAPVEPVEIELKLAVAPADLRGLRRRLDRFGQAVRSQVESIYYDTNERLLASRGLALRLRRLEDRWVQTLKSEARAAALSHRGEWEMPARIAGGRARIDLARLADTPLARLLGEHRGVRLVEAFRTHFERATWSVERGDARIELALDLGEIVAGRRRESIHELELELKSGAASALPALALHPARCANR
jgi:inorganic triphosphatase YgiF